MIKRVVAILAILFTFSIVPQVLFTDAYAKGPIRNSEHELGQYMQLLIVPMGISIVVLGVWAMRVRQNEIMVK